MSRAAALAVLLVASGCSRAEAAGGQRGPWLQGVGPNEATVKVELPVAEALVLVVEGGGKRLEKTGSARRLHALTATGLEPKTSYKYELHRGAADGPLAGGGTFTTAPRPAAGASFSFLVYGDSRSDPGAHRAVVEAMRKVPSDFLVNTGDLVALGDDEGDWASFFEVETPLLCDRCAFASVGNHELTNPSLQGANLPFLQYFAPIREGGAEARELHASFRWGNARFFLLNAMDDWGDEEKTWLEAELARARGEADLEHRVAVLHHGPFSSGPHGNNKRLHQRGIAGLLAREVDLVVSGHDHLYERGTGGGDLKYVVSGGAGAPLYPVRRKSPTAAVVESAHHFVEVHVAGPKLSLVAHRVAGGVIDRAGYEGKGPWRSEEAAAGGASPAASGAPTPAGPPPSPAGACQCSAWPGGAPGAASLAAAAALALAARRRSSLQRRAARG